MASTERLASGRYRGRYRDRTGKSMNTKTFLRKTDAQRAADEQERLIGTTEWVDPRRHRPLLTIPETAVYLNVSEKTVRRFAADMGAVRVGGQLRFSLDELDRYLNSRSLKSHGR